MITTTAVAYRNAIRIRNQDSAPESQTQPEPSLCRVGHPPEDLTGMGAGCPETERACPGSPSLAHEGFDGRLADEQAEVEYQAFLAEVEADHLNRDQEEDSAYWAGHLSAYLAGKGGCV